MALGVCATSYLSKIENEIVEPSDEMLDIFSSKLGLETTDLKLEVDLLHQLQLKALDFTGQSGMGVMKVRSSYITLSWRRIE